MLSLLLPLNWLTVLSVVLSLGGVFAALKLFKNKLPVFIKQSVG